MIEYQLGWPQCLALCYYMYLQIHGIKAARTQRESQLHMAGLITVPSATAL